jgi:cyclic pyranopterin phosphate synthase
MPPPLELVGSCERLLTYLRLSVTDRCNLRCTYCLPGQPTARVRHDEVLRYDEILRAVGVAVSVGVRKVRVTGGEPLVRRGVDGLLAALGRIEGLTELCLTTNGVLLDEHFAALQRAGVRRLNISLDTLKPERYRQITGQDAFGRVWQAIQEADRLGFAPIKLNVVAMRGVNDDEFADLAALTRRYPFHVRFIECMPIGHAARTPQRRILTPEIRQRLERLGPLRPVARQAGDGPAERFRLKDARGEIGFISAISRHFCAGCNRLRLTARGRLRPCLLSDVELDLCTPLRQGASDDALAEIFRQAACAKPSRHDLASADSAPLQGQMCAIGG